MNREIANIASEGTSILRMIIEPRQIRKITDATCDSLDKLKEKVDCYEEPTYITTNGIFVCNKSYSQMMNLYGCPHGPLGVKQLENIVNVLTKSEIKINSETLELVDIDWLMKAIDEIKFVSDDTLALAWNKLLKGKIERGNSYSKRTINLLANASKKDALLFEKYAKGIITTDDAGFLFGLKEEGEELLELKQLDYAGFINSIFLTFEDGKYNWNDYLLITSGKLNVYNLTQFGLDIFGILEIDMELKDYCKELKVLTENEVKWSLHKLIGKKYNTVPVLKYE